MRQVNVFKRLSAPFTLVILGAVIYSNALHGPFIFDDQMYIVDNSRIRDLRNFLGFSGTRYFTLLSFALNYSLGGLDTFGYHLFNITVHILNAALVYALVSLVMGASREGWGKGKPAPEGIAFAASLIFLVHPAGTQAVTYITQRFASLTTLFYLLSVVLYLRFRLSISNGEGKGAFLSWPSYAGSVIFTVIAQKTKETGFTLPVMIAFFEFVFFESPKKGLRTRALYLLPFILSLFIIPYTLFAPDIGPGGGNGFDAALLTKKAQLEDLQTLSWHSYLATEFRVIVTYLRLLFFPVNQFIDYDYPVFNSFLSPEVLLSFLFLAALFLAPAFYLARPVKKNSHFGTLVSSGVIWFFVTLSIESSFIPLKDVIFEHRLYLPGIGIIISSSALLLRGIEALTAKKAAAWAAVGALVIAGSVATINRNRAWGDEITLWRDVVKAFPNKARGYNNIAFALLGLGRFDEAIRYSEAAIRLQPEGPQPYNNIGYALAQTGRLDDALVYFGEAIKRRPDYTDAYNNMGNAFFVLGRLDDAIKKYREALSLDPGHANARVNLANAVNLKRYGGKMEGTEGLEIN